MKDTVLTARRKKIEIITLLVCFVLANLVNLYAIITYHRSMMEMITSIFYIIILLFVLYAAWALLRLLFYGGKRYSQRRETGCENRPERIYLININE